MHAVRAFYPLAGRLRLTPGTANHYELHYRPGDAVAFAVAEYDGEQDFESLAADDPREVAAIAPLAPPLPAGGAVLALQVTLLPARAGRGLALGVTVHHAACDGAGSTHFLHTWAAACVGTGTPPPPPVIDRTLISDTRGLYDVFCPPASSTGAEVGFVPMPKDQLLATFTLSRAHLQRIKDALAAAAHGGALPPPRCTSLVAALGFVWSCYHQAKLLRAGAGGDQTYFLLSVDHRSRLNPPLPAEYLGNCVAAAIAAAPRTELEEASVSGGGLLTACAAIAAGIEDAVSVLATETMDQRMERVGELADGGRVAEVPRVRSEHGVRQAGEGGRRVSGEDRRRRGGRRRRRDGGRRGVAACRHGRVPEELRRCCRGVGHGHRSSVTA
ncbi:hypothetical protein EJB05_29286, partial [Eragrostis curvula]